MTARAALSIHAEIRLAQRGIPPLVLDLLCQLGASKRSNKTEKIYFDKQSRRHLKNYLGGTRSLRLLEPWLGTYAVLADDGTVVTVGHRQKRINRN